MAVSTVLLVSVIAVMAAGGQPTSGPFEPETLLFLYFGVLHWRLLVFVLVPVTQVALLKLPSLR